MLAPGHAPESALNLTDSEIILEMRRSSGTNHREDDRNGVVLASAILLAGMMLTWANNPSLSGFLDNCR